MKNIIFDFDYTLADATRGILECFYYAYKMENMVCPPDDQLRRTIGMSVPDAFMQLNNNPDREQAEILRAHFRDKSGEIMVKSTRLLPFTRNLILELKRKGHRCAVASTKWRSRNEEFLKNENLLHLLDTVTGGEEVEHHKPSPDILNLCVDRMNVQAQDCIYIGDHPVDAQAAQKAGMEFIAVLSGVSTREEFRDFKVKAYLKNAGELLSHPELIR
jgi:phosphoglycolate phosphatase